MINCVCVLNCIASSRVVLSISLFFKEFCHKLCFAFTSLIFSADELELLSEGLDLLGVDPYGYDDEDD